MTGFLLVVAGIFGLAIGSFLNVGIYRLPRDISIKEPRRSFCPICKAQIPWRQNIPLVSWLVLRGRCANCGANIRRILVAQRGTHFCPKCQR